MSLAINRIDRISEFFNENKNSHWFYYGLVIINTWIAFFLRFYRLEKWGLSFDEAFTYFNAIKIINNFSVDFNSALVEHPITSFLIYVFTNLVGHSEWAIRFIPALAGTITITLLYTPLKKIFNEPIALLVMFLMAISPWHIFWSQNARFYVLLLLFCSYALLAFHFGLETGHRRWFITAFLFFGAALSERLLAILLFPVFLFIFLFSYFLPYKPKGLRFSNLMILLLPLLVISVIFGWQYIQNPLLWVDLFFQWLGNSPWEIARSFVYHVDVYKVGMGILGGVYVLRNRNFQGVVFIISAALIPIMVIVGASFQFVHVRYMFISLVSWYVLAAVTAVTLYESTINNIKWLMVAVLLLLLVIEPLQDNFDYFSSVNGDRNNWRAAFQYIQPSLQEKDVIISSVPEVGEYYLNRDVLSMENSDQKIDPLDLTESKERAWFIIGGKAREDASLRMWIESQGEQVYYDNQNIKVWLYIPGDIDFSG